MKVERKVEGEKTTLVFIPETEEENSILKELRRHFLIGVGSLGTSPDLIRGTVKNCLSIGYNNFNF